MSPKQIKVIAVAFCVIAWVLLVQSINLLTGGTYQEAANVVSYLFMIVGVITALII